MPRSMPVIPVTINKHLWVLLACVFVVMIGFGITLPVLPFYVERLALARGASGQSIVLHVTLLTGVYALGQRARERGAGHLRERRGRVEAAANDERGPSVSLALCTHRALR